MPLPHTPPRGRPHLCRVRLVDFTDYLPKPSDGLLTWHRIVFLTWSFKTCKAEAAIQLVGYLLSRQKVLGSISDTA